MNIEAAEPRCFEHGFRQDQAIGNHHGGVGIVGAERGLSFLVLQGLRRMNGERKPPRLLLHRRTLHVHPTAGRLGRARVDRRNLVPARGKLDECRHCEIRRAHENQAH